MAEKLQPYAAAYVCAHPEREWRGYEFIVWISQQWRDWHAEHDVERSVLTAEDHAHFAAWLADRWQVPAEGVPA